MPGIIPAQEGCQYDNRLEGLSTVPGIWKALINGAHDEGDNNNRKGPVPSQPRHTGSGVGIHTHVKRQQLFLKG